MSLADYQRTLQDARGHQIVYYEDFSGSDDEDFLERHFTDNDADPVSILEDRSVKEQLVLAIGMLPEREKLMMALYYEQDLNLREIGEVMGVTESRVCQLHTQAIARLRARIVGEIPAAAKSARRRLVDKISLAGLAISIVAIIGGQYLEGGSIGSLVQPTALLIVLGGTLGAVLLQSPIHVFKRGMKMAKWVWVPLLLSRNVRLNRS